MSRSEIIDCVNRVVDLLVKGSYDHLSSLTNNTRLSADDLRFSIDQYGRKLRTPPAEAWNQVDFVETVGKAYNVRFDLWTEEEGRSDLTLELTIKNGPESPIIEIDDIHVL